ncbi:MAG: GNAT family N-acetyltransferase [Cyanobacteria bacterium P01_D01_bin.156]
MGGHSVYLIREMVIADHPAMVKLLESTPGVTLRAADGYYETERYLARNPGLSFVAVVDESIIGMVMAGHDGRRGYLQHLLVIPTYRSQGIGTDLVNQCLQALAQQGIHKTHLFVFQENTSAQRFWQQYGCQLRDDVIMYSYNRSNNPQI